MAGTVVLSFDLELAWGQLDSPDFDEVLNGARYVHDHGVHAILALLDRYEIPATWACVGALLHNGLAEAGIGGEGAVERPRDLRIPQNGSQLTEPAYFAPDLLEAIRSSRVNHDVGFHGYTHVSFLDTAMTPARARKELAACRRLAQDRGFAGTSFVFPRNDVGHVALLQEFGFRCFRAPDRRRYPGSQVHIRLLEELLADWLCIPSLCVEPLIQAGVAAIPGSSLLTFAAGKRRRIPDSMRRRRLRAGIKRAETEARIFHAWLHPINLWPDVRRRLDVLEGFLEDIATARSRGRIRAATMADVAAETLGEKRASDDREGAPG